ncbi:MAG TPA: hypothetical protein VNN55_06015 [bacterium]|nr:hypothetical protein [bacterium]
MDLASALIIRDIAEEQDSVILRADIVDIDWYNEDTLICGVYHGQVILVEITTGRTNVIWSGNGWQTTVAEQGRVAMIEYYAETAIVDSSAVVTSDVGGSPAQLLTIFRKEYCAAPELSRGGDRIVLIRDFLFDPRLALVTVPGGIVTDALALHTADPYYLDDHLIIYVHLGDKSVGGTDQIWIMNDDGSGMRRLLPNEASGSMTSAESPLGRH